MLDSIQRFFQLARLDLQRQPGQITARQVIALRTGFATLTLFAPRQLLEFAVQLLDLPAPGILVLNVGGGERAFWMIGNHPLNVAVWGNHLE